MIKAQNLEPTLLAIIFVCDVFRMLLPEQDTTKKGRVYEMYEIYEMYKNKTQLEFEFDLRCYNSR